MDVKSSREAKDEIGDLEGSIQEMLSSLQKAHNEIRNLAYFDQLTGFPNRFSLYKEFEKRTMQENAVFTVLFFDLDGFKQINDLLVTAVAVNC